MRCDQLGGLRARLAAEIRCRRARRRRRRTRPRSSVSSATCPASRRTRAATRPSPPFDPPPQTQAKLRAAGNASIASRATAAPARSMSSGNRLRVVRVALLGRAHLGGGVERLVGLSHPLDAAHDGDRGRDLARVRHREVDRARADALGERRRPPRQPHARLRSADDLDLLPRESHAAAERLPDRLLAGEPSRVALRRARRASRSTPAPRP